MERAAPPLTNRQRVAVDRIVRQLDGWLDKLDEGRIALGSAVLRDVFGGDARKMAAPDRLSNGALSYLYDRVAEGRRIPLKSFSMLLRLHAYDQLVAGADWPKLKTVVKERLLPLVDEARPTSPQSLARLKGAAEEALSSGQSSANARRYTRSQLLAQGRAPVRRAGYGTFTKLVDTCADQYETTDGLGRVLTVADRTDPKLVEELRAKLERTAKAMLEAAKKLAGRGRRKSAAKAKKKS